MNTFEKVICIDARYIFPKMDGIGRYLFNLIDHISLLAEERKNLRFLILEVEKFASTSILRKLDARSNLNFVKIPILPQTIANHFLQQKYLSNYHIDVFHYPQFDLPFFLTFPSVVTIHDLNPQTFPNFFSGLKGYLKKYYAILTNGIALLKAEEVITISQNTKRELLKFYGEKFGSKTKVIYLGVDKNNFLKGKNSIYLNILKEVREKYNFYDYFLYVGNNRPHKNLGILLEAFKKYKDQSKNNLKLLLVGQFVKSSTFNVEEKINEFSLKGEVIHLTANDDQLQFLYLNAKAFVFLSLSEGFGLPILEAMALGVPVITSKRSSLQEIGEGAAILVNPLSIDEVAAALSKVTLYNSEILEKIEVGKKRVEEFTWLACAEKTMSIYDLILNNNE